MDEKRCQGSCGLTKPLSCFHRDRTKPDGQKARCKVCRAEEGRRYYAEHREEARARNRRWRRKHPNYGREWRREHPSYYRDRYLAWRG
jgi:hypothetical protein